MAPAALAPNGLTASEIARKKLEKVRHEREIMWTDHHTIEAEVLEPYVAFEKMSDYQWIEHMRHRAVTVQETNAVLQDQLAEQELILQEMRAAQEESRQRDKQLQDELNNAKEFQGTVEAKLRQVKEGCRAEEQRLRNQDVSLHSQISFLARENLRLEDSCIHEEHLIGQHKSALADIRQKHAKLLARRGELEGLTESASCGPSRMGMRESPQSRCDSSASIPAGAAGSPFLAGYPPLGAGLGGQSSAPVVAVARAMSAVNNHSATSSATSSATAGVASPSLKAPPTPRSGARPRRPSSMGSPVMVPEGSTA